MHSVELVEKHNGITVVLRACPPPSHRAGHPILGPPQYECGQMCAAIFFANVHKLMMMPSRETSFEIMTRHCHHMPQTDLRAVRESRDGTGQCRVMFESARCRQDTPAHRTPARESATQSASASRRPPHHMSADLRRPEPTTGCARALCEPCKGGSAERLHMPGAQSSTWANRVRCNTARPLE